MSNSTKLAQSAHALWGQLKDQGLANRGSMYSFAVDLYKEEEGFNPRNYNDPETVEHIRSLADAYKRGDKLPPVWAKIIDGVPHMWDGHCRLRGARLAISEGTVINGLEMMEMQGDAIARNKAVLKSKDGLPLKALEVAEMVNRLKNLLVTEEKVAEELGKSKAYVIQYLELYNLPLNLKQMIKDDLAAWSTVTKAFRDHGTKAYDIITAIQAQKAPVVADADDAAGVASADTSEVKPDVVAVKPAPVKARIRPAEIAAASGYRASFSPKLVISVTDGMKMLESKLAGASDEGVALQLDAEELAALRKLIADVKPKPAGAEEAKPEVVDAKERVAA
jgi:ParB family chromosome partitioning protein